MAQTVPLWRFPAIIATGSSQLLCDIFNLNDHNPLLLVPFLFWEPAWDQMNFISPSSRYFREECYQNKNLTQENGVIIALCSHFFVPHGTTGFYFWRMEGIVKLSQIRTMTKCILAVLLFSLFTLLFEASGCESADPGITFFQLLDFLPRLLCCFMLYHITDYFNLY